MNDLLWQFNDQPNTAVIADRNILYSGEWIAYVYHDSDDGGWQFHTYQTLKEENAVLVSLESIVNQDQSLHALADLPLGWFACRSSEKDVWKRFHQSE